MTIAASHASAIPNVFVPRTDFTILLDLLLEKLLSLSHLSVSRFTCPTCDDSSLFPLKEAF